MSGYFYSYIERLQSATERVMYSWQDDVGRKHEHMNDEILRLLPEMETLHETASGLHTSSKQLYDNVQSKAETIISAIRSELNSLRE